MDSLAQAQALAAASGLEHQVDIGQAVVLVVRVVGDGAQTVVRELLRRMALLAGLPRRAKILDRGSDGALVAIGEDRQHLRHPADFRAHQVAAPIPHVAFGAGIPHPAPPPVKGTSWPILKTLTS